MRPLGIVVFSLVALALRMLLGLFPSGDGWCDPLLVVAVVAALPGRDARAMGGGLVTGMLKDGWLARWYGQYSLGHLVIAFVLGRIAAAVDLMQPVPVMLSLAVATLADRGLQSLLCNLFGQSVPSFGWLSLMLAMAGNVVLGLIVVHFARRWGWLDE